jgi:hypothetical protein
MKWLMVPLSLTVFAGTSARMAAQTATIASAAPVAAITATTPVTAGTAGLTATVPEQTGCTYAWTITNATGVSGAATRAFSYTAGTAGTMVLKCTVKNPAGVSTLGSKTVSVAPVPHATITAASPVTAGKTGLVASVPGQTGCTYAWTLTGGTITAGKGTRAITYTAGPTGTATLRCTVKNTAGASDSQAKAVTIIAAPVAAITAMNPVTTGITGLVASVPIQDGSTYKWTLTGAAITAGAGTSVITYRAGAAGSATLACTVKNAAGATITGTKTLTIVPVPPMTHALGINLPGPTYWDHLHWMVDMMANADFRKSGPWSGAELDANGWPTEDFRIILSEGNEPAGDYSISFQGKAASITLDSGGMGLLVGNHYEEANNTTSVRLRMTSPMSGLTSLIVTGTQRTKGSATGTGIIGFRIIRPGYPIDGSIIFTNEFLAALRKFKVIRSMDYMATNQNPTQEWADRSLMAWAGFGGGSGAHAGDPQYIEYEGGWYPRGAPWERFIQMANAANVDVWINVPCMASDDYITKLANLIRYGSDGVNPYTSVTANPVYAPLNGNLKVYLEYGNEIWNFSGGFMNYPWVQALAKNIHDNEPSHPINYDGRLAGDNQWYTLSMERYVAYRSSVISEKFREVFGDGAMMSRIRPVFTYQVGGGIKDGLEWAAGYYQTTVPARAVNEIWYGAGGAAYYDSNATPDSTVPAVMSAYFAGLPNDQFTLNTARDSAWAKAYGLKLVAYEGGPGPGGTSTGGTSASERVTAAYNADPRMKDGMLRAQKVWDSYDADLLVYYTLPGDGPWGFGNETSTVSPINTVKLKAISAINAAPKGPITTAATRVPGAVLLGPENPAVIVSGGGWSGPGCYALKEPSQGAGSLLFPIQAAIAGKYNLVVMGAGNTATAKLDLFLNGQLLHTSIALPSGAMAPATPVLATLLAGLSYIRLVSSADSPVAAYVYSLIVTPVDGNIPKPLRPPVPTGLVASSTESTTAHLAWTAVGTASYYKIFRGISAAVKEYGYSTTPSFSDQKLTPGTLYYYAVQAVNAAGASLSSALAQVRPLSSPVNVTLTPSGTNALIAAWTAVPGASGYIVKYATEKGNSRNGIPAGTTALTHTIGGLVTGKRYYVCIEAKDAVGGGATIYSDEVSAIAGGGSVPPTPNIPPPSGTAVVGNNLSHPSYWDGLHWLVDMVRGGGDFRRLDWTTAQMNPVDGWPVEDFLLIFSGEPEPTGTYKLSFKGKASISVATSHGTVSLDKTTYNAGTNTTTADVVITEAINGVSWLTFHSTQRTASSAVGSGLTDMRLIRPGYPVDGSVVFTNEFITAAQKFHVLRTMDFGDTNGNPVREWSERDLIKWPGFVGAGGHPERSPHAILYNGQYFLRGGPWELMIQMANAAGVDLWINVPCRASDDYMTKLAQLLRYGSNGIEPYTSVQANPVYPPLDVNRKIYLEYGNEIWNSAAGFMCSEWVSEFSESARLSSYSDINYDGMASTDSWLAKVRYTASRSAALSFAFRKVFGDAAMMTRVRPVLTSWAGDGGGTLSGGLRWAEGYFAPDYQPSNIWFGAGGAAYEDSTTEPSSTDPDVMSAYFAGLPSADFTHRIAIDSLWTRLFGLKLIAYEGGPGIGGTATGGIGSNATLSEFYSADPRMKDRMIAAHEIWDSYGGDLLAYYTLGGVGPWGFGNSTALTSPTDTMKLQAIDAIRTLTTTAVADPGITIAETGTTQVSTVTSNPLVLVSGAYWYGSGGSYSLRNTAGAGSAYNTGSLAFTVRTLSAGDYDISLTTIAPSATLSLRVNNQTTDKYGAPARFTLSTSQNSQAVSAPIRMTLPAGLNSIRLQVIEPAAQNATLFSVNITPVGP